MKCALIGDPVKTSISHITHNYILSLLGFAPEFGKIQTPIQELEERLSQLQSEGYRYLAVTMPLKEHIIPHLHYLTEAAQKSGAVNFVDLQNRTGYNTDGQGAMKAIATLSPIQGKNVCIMGSGGTAKAQIYSALQRGADVYLLCRNLQTLNQVCANLGCKPYDHKLVYDVVINATPIGMSTCSHKTWDFPLPTIQRGQVVLDNVYHPPLTPLLIYAKEKGATAIGGKEMFIHMALAQFQCMLGRQICSVELLDSLRKIVEFTKS